MAYFKFKGLPAKRDSVPTIKRGVTTSDDKPAKVAAVKETATTERVEKTSPKEKKK